MSDFPGDKTNEYLKRPVPSDRLLETSVFIVFPSGRTKHRIWSVQSGSGPEGLSFCPPRSATTRKSMIVDAVELWEARADGLFLKPDGPSDQAIHQATARTAADLVEKWGRIVAGRLNSYYQEVAVKLYRAGLGRDLSLDSLLKNMPDEVRGKLEPLEIRFFQAAGSWF